MSLFLESQESQTPQGIILLSDKLSNASLPVCEAMLVWKRVRWNCYSCSPGATLTQAMVCLATEGVPSPKKSKKNVLTHTHTHWLGFLVKLVWHWVVSKEVLEGTKIPGHGGRGRLNPMLHCHHQNDIKMGCDDSHFNVSLTVRDKVTRQCLETTTFEERGELKQSQTEGLLLMSLMSYYQAKPSHPHPLTKTTHSGTQLCSVCAKCHTSASTKTHA